MREWLEIRVICVLKEACNHLDYDPAVFRSCDGVRSTNRCLKEELVHTKFIHDIQILYSRTYFAAKLFTPTKQFCSVMRSQ